MTVLETNTVPARAKVRIESENVHGSKSELIDNRIFLTDNSNNSRMSDGHLASESEVPMSEDEHSECEFERDVVEEKCNDEVDEVNNRL